LVTQDLKDEGEIKWKDFKDFFSYSYGCTGIVILVIISILTSILQLLPSLWLTEWLSADLEEQQKPFYPIVFCVMIGVFIIFTLIRSCTLSQIIL
jgi:hypothetical protein